MSSYAQPHTAPARPPAELDLLYELAGSLGVPFVSPDNGRPYYRVHSGSHVIPIRSAAFRDLLHSRWLDATGRPARQENVRHIGRCLAARATFGSEPARVVHLRLAASGKTITLHLADDQNRIVYITPDGWRVTGDSAECFLRPPCVLPLPAPIQPRTPGATPSLDRLRDLLRIPREPWLRVLAWLLAALQPTLASVPYNLQYPILALHGPAGSGKSFAAMCLRALIDPSSAPFLNHTRTGPQICRLALSSRVVAYDGLLRISSRSQDALAALSSGAGLDLYEPGATENVRFFFSRPQLLTLDSDHAGSGSPYAPIPKLRHRTFSVPMEPIAEPERRDPAGLRREFLDLAPLALGELCTALSAVLARSGPACATRRLICLDTSLPTLSAAPKLGLHPHVLEQALAVPDPPIVTAIIRLLTSESSWTGTPAALTAALPSAPGIPNNPIALSRLLHAAHADLAAAGIRCAVRQTHRRRQITLERNGCKTDNLSTVASTWQINPLNTTQSVMQVKVA